METGLRFRSTGKEEEIQDGVYIPHSPIPPTKSWRLAIQDRIDNVLVYIANKNWIRFDTSLTSKKSLFARSVDRGLTFILILFALSIVFVVAVWLTYLIEKNVESSDISQWYPKIKSYTATDNTGCDPSTSSCLRLVDVDNSTLIAEHVKKTICVPLMPSDFKEYSFMVYAKTFIQLHNLFQLQEYISKLERDTVPVVSPSLYMMNGQVKNFPCICTSCEAEGSYIHWINPRIVSLSKDTNQVVVHYSDKASTVSIPCTIQVDYKDKNLVSHENVTIEGKDVVYFLECMDMLYANQYIFGK